MADQTKRSGEEYDSVCAKVRVTQVLFVCRKHCLFSLASFKLKVAVFHFTFVGLYSLSEWHLSDDVSCFFSRCYMRGEEPLKVMNYVVYIFGRATGVFLLVFNYENPFFMSYSGQLSSSIFYFHNYNLT